MRHPPIARRVALRLRRGEPRLFQRGIAENVAEASKRSGTGAEAMARVSRATEHARGTGRLVGELSDTLGAQAELLRKEIGAFLDGVRAA